MYVDMKNKDWTYMAIKLHSKSKTWTALYKWDVKLTVAMCSVTIISYFLTIIFHAHWWHSPTLALLPFPSLHGGHSVHDQWPVRSSKFSLGLHLLNYVSVLCMVPLVLGCQCWPCWILVFVCLVGVFLATRHDYGSITTVALSLFIYMLYLFVLCSAT